MITASNCPAPLGAFIGPMLRLPAWNVTKGHGSFLTLEFGQPAPDVKEQHSPEKGLRKAAQVHGQSHLWIYCCHWRVLQSGKLLAGSEDADQLIGRATDTLNAHKLLALSVAPDDGRSTFTFDLGVSLETWAYGDDPTDQQWSISTDAETFSYRADGLYACELSSTPPGLVRWLPFS